jgi:signal transduction histidine kinase/DNA-binding LacI/PurR family transcriptional regulator/ActR/RegA family two-component response regulator
MKEQRKTRRRAPGRKRAARPTIGMFINNLIGNHQVQWLGAVDAARAHQANLATFAGRELGRPDHFYAQANVIYDLISPQHVDGLIIWTTTLQLFVGQQQLEAFCQHYRSLPIVSVEQPIAGLPSLLMDNQRGMCAAVNHLIEVHGLRRIAFIRGPTNHPGAQERYQGYVEALAQHGLPLDATLVSAPTRFWLPDEAAALVHQLLDEHTTEIEAIVATNDDLALGVLTALQARQIRVPGEIAVVGFDNGISIDRADLAHGSISDNAAGADVERAVNLRATTLSLTTVQPPFYELGSQAVELLLAQIRGEDVPEVVTIPTELIVRRSCGCFSQAMRPLAPAPIMRLSQQGPVEQPFAQTTAAHHKPLTAQLQHAMGPAPAELAPEWAERLLTAYISEVRGKSGAAFLAVLDELVGASLQSGSSLERWWRVLFALRRQTVPDLVTGGALMRAEGLWQQVQVLMGEMAEQFYVSRQLLVEKRDEILREIGQKLITTFDLGQLTEILAQELPHLGIERCYLALYEPEREGEVGARLDVGAAGYPAEWSRAILAYEQRRLKLKADEALFPSRLLAPGDRLRHTQPYNIVVEPLYFRDQQLGFVLFEVGPREGWVYEVLRGQLSSALQGALLVKQTQEQNRLLNQEIGQRQRAEAALQQAQAELEQRIAARTAELAQANESLTAQILERERAEEIQANLEAQLRQAQKMDAIGQLAGGIAHDFNNLLVVISGYSDLLLSALDAGDEISKQDVEQIQHAGERAATLTRQLLAFSRQQVLQPRVLSLNDVVTNLELMLRRLIGEDIQLATLLAPNLAPVTADPGQIEQMIVNLAVNARDAMPHGGQLTIETANLELDQEYARHNVGVQAGPYVLLRVSDTGLGMDAATQARIFEPFFTTKPQGKGTGLGLATVFGIVQQSGGHIAVASVPNQGTTFTIYLPQSARAVEDNEPELALPRSAVTGSETILVVEDDPGVRGATCRFLKERGYLVLEASDGLEALRLCQQHKGPIHLVITDVVMPHMSGGEFVERLASVRPELPVLYVSGYTDSTIIRHGISEASISLLQKPFTADDLARKVRELLDLRMRVNTFPTR